MIRLLMVTAGLLAIISQPGHAISIASKSRIDRVTVYPSGARITRTAKIKLNKGSHVIVFEDIAAQAIPGSIQVQGQATGKLEIISVDSRRISVTRADPTTLASERKRIENKIETLRDERAAIDTAVQAAQAQITLLNNLTQLPLRRGPANLDSTTQGRLDWGQIYAMIGIRMGDAQGAVLKNRIAQREIDRRIKDLQGSLNALAPNSKSRTQVKVHVEALATLDVDLTIQYQIRRASWRPLYDARLTTGAKSVAPQLVLSRRATITQRTGESWDNVKLELSTTRPAASTSAPELVQRSVDFFRPSKYRPIADMAIQESAPRSAPARKFDHEQDMRRRMPGMTAAAKPASAVSQKARSRRAKVRTAPFQAIYVIMDRQSIVASGAAKRVTIDRITLEPTLLVRTVPKRLAKAFLYAQFTLPNGAPLLSGSVQLFRDATFVGSGRIPHLQAGKTHNLGFGQDDAVEIKYAILEEKRGQTGIISSSKTDQRHYKLTIKNRHERAVKVVALDQVPISKHDDIRVELISKPTPTKRNIKDRQGVLAWEKTLLSDETYIIKFGYRITWPSGKEIKYGR